MEEIWLHNKMEQCFHSAFQMSCQLPNNLGGLGHGSVVEDLLCIQSQVPSQHFH